VKVRGGDNIVTCFDVDGIYEVQKDSLIITIRRILKIKKNKTPLFIEPAVLFLAYMVDRQVKNLTLLHRLYGIDIFLEKKNWETCTSEDEEQTVVLSTLIDLMIAHFQPILGKLEKVPGPKEKIILRTCDLKKKYIKLEHRTKTFNDVRLENNSENMEKIQPMIESYKGRSRRIDESRLQN